MFRRNSWKLASVTRRTLGCSRSRWNRVAALRRLQSQLKYRDLALDAENRIGRFWTSWFYHVPQIAWLMSCCARLCERRLGASRVPGSVSSGRHIRFRPAGLVFIIGQVGRRRLEKLKKDGMSSSWCGCQWSPASSSARQLGTWRIASSRTLCKQLSTTILESKSGDAQIEEILIREKNTPEGITCGSYSAMMIGSRLSHDL